MGRKSSRRYSLLGLAVLLSSKLEWQYLAIVLAGIAISSHANAGLFDDEKARKKIEDLQARITQNEEQQNRGLLQISNQIQQIKDDLAVLRGQIETLNNKVISSEKRLQDYYIDLDSRVRKLNETATATTTNPTQPASADEIKVYEAALDLFKKKQYSEASEALNAFSQNYPESSLAPNAQLWLGYALSAQGNCKKALPVYSQLVQRWPKSPKAPDAILASAGCEKNTKIKQKILEMLIEKFPESDAAKKAQKRLSKK